jgi:GntR family transcriptional regulator
VHSLYAVLDAGGVRPVRALQRLSAANLAAEDAALLGVATGAAALAIERISFLASHQPVEFTQSWYRGDAYDFVAELSLRHES